MRADGRGHQPVRSEQHGHRHGHAARPRGAHRAANLTANAVGGGQADLAWEAATDNVGVTGYRIYRNDQLVATIDPATSYSDTVPPGDYTYVVRALDAAGHESAPSNAADVTVPDTEHPTPPENLTATAVSPSQIDLAWEASADNVAVTSYEIYRDDALLTTIGPATSYSDSVIAPATHKYEVRALDAAGNVSAFSNSDTATRHAAGPRGARGRRAT